MSRSLDDETTSPDLLARTAVDSSASLDVGALVAASLERDEPGERSMPGDGPASPPLGMEASLADIGVAVIEADARGQVTRFNGAAERITGWTAYEALGAPLDRVFRLVPGVPSSSETQRELELAKLTAAQGGTRDLEASIILPDRTGLLERRDGGVVPVRHVVGRSLRPAAGPFGSLAEPASADPDEAGTLVVFRDLGTEQLLSLQLVRRARYDALTGLLTRRALEDRIERAIGESRVRQVHHGLCYFDLDRFRLINMTCGHGAGDDLLQWVALRVHEVIGQSDRAARIGGDEFAVLLVERDAAEVERLVRELQRRLLEFRFAWNEKTFSVAASFGVVFFGAEAAGAGELLSAADDACRRAKQAGRGRLQVVSHDDEEMRHSKISMQWVASLQRNLAEGRLQLYAQAIRPLAQRPGDGVRFEILVRQRGDDGQLESPVRIIRAAENIGLMDAIDRFVVQKALRLIGSLGATAMERLDCCSINLSGISLAREGLLDFIVDELQRAQVPPTKVCFEITETAAVANLAEVQWLMHELRGMGCRFAIDDFGSGHASYGYVERLPVDHVKIDGLFVRDLIENPLHRAIVDSVHLIGRTLQIKTVAECVESQKVADVLADIGIDYGQGWLYGQPRPLAEVCAELAQVAPAAPASGEAEVA